MAGRRAKRKTGGQERVKSASGLGELPSEARQPQLLSPAALTILTAIGASLLVFLYLLITTGNLVSSEYSVGQWASDSQSLLDSGQGVTFEIDKEQAFLVHGIQRPDSRYSRVSFEFFLKEPLAPQLLLVAWRGGGRPSGVLDLSRRVGRTGWNAVTASFDEAEGFSGAGKIGLVLSSPQGRNIVGVRNARLEASSYLLRLKEMVSSLFRNQPLNQGGNNFIYSQKVAGRGYGFILWVALILTAAVLLIRRFALGESIALTAHFGLAVVVLFALADLRNSVDYFMNARAAIALRSGSKEFLDLLRKQEVFFPWFADAVEAVTTDLPKSGAYYLNMGSGPGVYEAAMRAAYYGRPAEKTDDLKKAEIAVVSGATAGPFESSKEWREKKAYPSGVKVYERVK